MADDLFTTLDLDDDSVQEATPDLITLGKLDGENDENDADDETSTARSSGSASSLPDLIASFDSSELVESQDEGNCPANELNTRRKRGPLLKDIGSHSSVTSTSSVSSNCSDSDESKLSRRTSAVDGLLFEIYEQFHHREWAKSIDSDVTECSTTSHGSVYFASSFEHDESRPKLDRAYLETKDIEQLERMMRELKRTTTMLSSKLVRLLKQRDRNAHKLQQNFDLLTAILQAVSLKRRVDTRIRFSFMPRPGRRGFRQWSDAFRSIARLPAGLPSPWRKRTWLCLSEFYIRDVDWEKTRRVCFNDRRNPDDDELDTQIVKDLHRTGCGWFFENDTAEDRASLKRVLLAYARWNKAIGYCQGFNVIAALILQVMEGSEEDALKVMIYLVDHVLPRNYFANNLRALSVDMAVLRDLMSIKLSNLSRHLDALQKESMSSNTVNGTGTYEPPLINVFTMQWFLTLFATCLPRETVLRIWDAVLLEGSEVLLRVALAIWAKLGDYLNDTETAADFYMKMGSLIQNMMDEEFIEPHKLMQAVYTMAAFPFVKVYELREKYTYDIHPFPTVRHEHSPDRKTIKNNIHPVSSDEEEENSDSETLMVGCLGFFPKGLYDQGNHNHRVPIEKVVEKTDIGAVSPGAVGTGQEFTAFKMQTANKERKREGEKLDLSKLQKQYLRMQRLQENAVVVFSSVNHVSKQDEKASKIKAINHLFVDLKRSEATLRDMVKTDQKKKEHLRGKIEDHHRPHIPLKKAPMSLNRPEKSWKNPHDNLYTGKDTIMAVGIHSLDKIVEVNENSDGSSSSELASMPVVNTSASVTRKKIGHHHTPVNMKSQALFRVDKNALYPRNFKPFPTRNPHSKSKLLVTGKL